MCVPGLVRVGGEASSSCDILEQYVTQTFYWHKKVIVLAQNILGSSIQIHDKQDVKKSI